MKPINHNMDLLIQTKSSNCVQTAVSQLLTFFGKKLSPDVIEKAVPVRFNDEGLPLGTLLPDIGSWLMDTQDLDTTLHVFDAQLIDRSWTGIPRDEIVANLEKLRQTGVTTARTPYAKILIDSYCSFLDKGGRLDITFCTTQLITSLLKKAPLLAIVNYNYLYNAPRCAYDAVTKEYQPNSIDGKVIGHAIVITGYEDGVFTINDPDCEKGGKNRVERDVLIGAICAEQISSNNFLLSLTPKHAN